MNNTIKSLFLSNSLASFKLAINLCGLVENGRLMMSKMNDLILPELGFTIQNYTSSKGTHVRKVYKNKTIEYVH